MMFLDDGWTMSFCPVLGKEHPQIHSGPCPWHLQSPLRKKLSISFIGLEPYIRYRPTIGGSDFELIKILAKRYRFLPQFIPERSYDSIEINGTFSGMVYSVSQHIVSIWIVVKSQQFFTGNRCLKRKVK